MTNDECRRNDETVFVIFAFVLLSSFVIRASSFLVYDASRRAFLQSRFPGPLFDWFCFSRIAQGFVCRIVLIYSPLILNWSLAQATLSKVVLDYTPRNRSRS